jgi:hypothetical protein
MEVSTEMKIINMVTYLQHADPGFRMTRICPSTMKKSLAVPCFLVGMWLLQGK